MLREEGEMLKAESFWKGAKGAKGDFLITNY